jgi:hypothetical protein
MVLAFFIREYYSFSTPYGTHDEHPLSSEGHHVRCSCLLTERAHRRRDAAPAVHLTPIVGARLAIPPGSSVVEASRFRDEARRRPGPFWPRGGLPNQEPQRCHRQPAPLEYCGRNDTRTFALSESYAKRIASENGTFPFYLTSKSSRNTAQCCLENLWVRTTLWRTAIN